MRSVFLLGIVAATACGPQNTLGGSIGEEFDISFDRVDIIKQDADLLVEYVKESDTGKDLEKNCKIIVPEAKELGLKDDSSLTGDDFLRNVTIERIAENRKKFPEVTSGSITMKTFEFKEDGEVVGEFDAVFENGRTLSGEFHGNVDEIDITE